MKKHYIRILNPIYPFKIHVFLNCTSVSEIKSKVKSRKKEYTKSLHEKIDELDFKNVHGRAFEHLGHIIIFVKKFNGKPECYDSLHHEITHAVDLSAEYIGIEQPTYVREYSAYMHGFITNQIYKKILN